MESESPAERAGLRAGSDYLLGTPDRVFRDADDLHDEILDALDGSFQCYVYKCVAVLAQNTRVKCSISIALTDRSVVCDTNSSEDDQVRIVSIVPTERWGGDGVLGAEVAHGYLHRLPTESRGTVGSSVGFVKLPLDALAATDAFSTCTPDFHFLALRCCGCDDRVLCSQTASVAASTASKRCRSISGDGE